MHFSGGVRPFFIETNEGTELWEQYSQAADTMRPYFILPGKENDDLMDPVCERIDKEAKEAEKFSIEVEGQEIKITCKWHLSLDGKLIDCSTGLSKQMVFHFTFRCKHITVHMAFFLFLFRWSTLYKMSCNY